MITFDRLGGYGRLGNQLFQYAALKSLSLKNGYDFKIPPQNKMHWHGQKSLMYEFNILAQEYTIEEFRSINRRYVEPSWRTIDEKFFNIPDNTNIEGFFQSIWYFEDYIDEIKKELTPKEHHIEGAKKYLQSIRDKYPNTEIVSIHIRRGNVVNDVSLRKVFNEYYKIGGEYFQYLERAKNEFKDKKVKYLIFSGGAKWDENNENEISWCKKYLTGEDYLFSEKGSPIEDFSRIMLCDHNIMSPASSYGWWASFLNPNKNKIVIFPKNYLVTEPNFTRYKFVDDSFLVR